MKKTILIIMILILSLPLAFALYGGETWTYNFPECKELEVNISATDIIDTGEYTILNNCTENKTNYWICDCENDYNFSIKFNIASVNNYSFDFNYMYQRVEQDQSSGSSGGSGGSRGSGTFTLRFEVGKPVTRYLTQNIPARFWVNGEQHTIKVTKISKENGVILVEIKSELQRVDLFLNKPKVVTLDNENLEMTLIDIRGRVAIIKFEKLSKITDKEYSNILEDNCEYYRVYTNDPEKFDGEGSLLYHAKTIEFVIGSDWVSGWECETYIGETPTIDEPIKEPIKELDIPLEEDEKKPRNIKGVLIVLGIIVVGLIAFVMYKNKKKKEEPPEEEGDEIENN